MYNFKKKPSQTVKYVFQKLGIHCKWIFKKKNPSTFPLFNKKKKRVFQTEFEFI